MDEIVRSKLGSDEGAPLREGLSEGTELGWLEIEGDSLFVSEGREVVGSGV